MGKGPFAPPTVDSRPAPWRKVPPRRRTRETGLGGVESDYFRSETQDVRRKEALRRRESKVAQGNMTTKLLRRVRDTNIYCQ